MSENVTEHKAIEPDYTKELITDLRVSADEHGISSEERKKRVKKLAGAISHSLRTSGEINVRTFGNAAIGKATKALAIARGYISQTNQDIKLSFSPAFIEADIGGQSLTGIKFATFTTEADSDVNLDNVEIVLMVKADHKGISSEERKIKVRKLAGAISHAVEEKKECVIRCFGNAAIGKAAKALAIARGFTATRGPDLYCWAEFIVSEVDEGVELTGLAFYAYSNE